MVEITNYLKDFLLYKFVHQGNWDLSDKRKIEFKTLLEKKNYCVYIWIARKKIKLCPCILARFEMELMTLFYSDLTKTLNPVTSFEKAQKEMRNKYPTEPEKWAGFVLVR